MRAIVIYPDTGVRNSFQEAANGFPNLTLMKRLDKYPASDKFVRMIRSWAPEVIFISLENVEEAARLCAELDLNFPEVPRVGLAVTADPFFFRLALRLKMRELLACPFDPAELARVLDELERHFEAHPVKIAACDRFYAFMPAKAGVGASVIAASVARALGAAGGSRSLLADFDLHSGISGFLFDVEHDFCLTDALRMSQDLDEQSWSKLIRSVGKTDLLLSGAPFIEDQGVRQAELTNVLDYMRRNYDTVIADLPGTFDGVSLAVLHEANHIFLVTTPEVASLRLARQRMLLLQKLEMAPRVSLIVNRTHKRMDLSLSEIEQTVGAAISMTFPSDYAAVSEAIRKGTCPASLAPAVQSLTEKLVSKQILETKRDSFIERFALVPLRYGFR